jgi:hypothetical protein
MEINLTVKAGAEAEETGYRVLVDGALVALKAIGEATEIGLQPTELEEPPPIEPPPIEPPPIGEELPPATGDPAVHAWFEARRADPSCVGAITMRDQAEIDEHTAKAPNELYRYVWPDDDHPERQDGAKYTLPATQSDGSIQASQPTNKKVELKLKIYEGIVIVSWEFYFTRDWQYAFTAQPGDEWSGYKFKTFQLTHPADKIYFESRNLWGKVRGPAYVSVADVRNYDMGDQMARDCGVEEPVGYMPTGERAYPNYGADCGQEGGLDIPVAQWLRYYKEVQIGVDAAALESWNSWRSSELANAWPPWQGPVPSGKYNILSEYIAGETFDPICVLDRVPAFYKEGLEIGKFYFEMNTSAKNLRHGDAIGYARNVVAWRAEKGLAEDPSPLSRPSR